MDEIEEKCISFGIPRHLVTNEDSKIKKTSIVGADEIENYFQKVISYNQMPMIDVFLTSKNIQFCKKVAVMMARGFAFRRILCQWQSVITLTEKSKSSYEFLDKITNVRVLFLTDLGYEPSNDFNQSRDLILKVLENRHVNGLNTVFVSDLISEDEIRKIYSSKFINIAFQNITKFEVSESGV